MGFMNGLLMGIGAAGTTYGENRIQDQREAIRQQAELDKENRIREANRADTALARENTVADAAEEQRLKLAGMQKTLDKMDSANVPDSVKSDNLAYKDELNSIKANRTAMLAAGTLDEKAAKVFDEREKLIVAAMHDNLQPYMTKADNPMLIKGVNDTAKYDDAFKDASITHGVSLPILKAVGEVESGRRQFDKDGKAINPGTSTATGVMQVIPRWHPQFDKELLANDPAYNINAGAKILSDLYDETSPKLPDKERTSLALQRYYGSKDDSENIAYANKVMGASKQFAEDGLLQKASNDSHSNSLPSAVEPLINVPTSTKTEQLPESNQVPQQYGRLNLPKDKPIRDFITDASGRSAADHEKELMNKFKLIGARYNYLDGKPLDIKNAFISLPINEQIKELMKLGYIK